RRGVLLKVLVWPPDSSVGSPKPHASITRCIGHPPITKLPQGPDVTGVPFELSLQRPFSDNLRNRRTCALGLCRLKPAVHYVGSHHVLRSSGDGLAVVPLAMIEHDRRSRAR